MFLTEFEGYNLTKYNDFLVECSRRNYSTQIVHSHHILPRFMGGADNKENLIKLNQQDHFDAHLILAFCFPNTIHYYHGNIISAHRLSIGVITPDNFLELYSETQRITCYGRKHLEKSKKKISESKKGKSRPRWIIEKMNASRRGKKHSEEHKQHLSEVMKELYATGKKKVDFGDRNSPKNIEYRKKLSERGKTQQSRSDNPTAKKILHIESGEIFNCLKDAIDKFELKSYGKLNELIKLGVFRLLEDRPPTHENLKYGKKAKSLIHVETGKVFKSQKDVISEFQITSYPVLYRLINQGIFKYSEDSATIPKTSCFQSRSKSVIDNKTGKVYSRIKDLRDEFGYTQWEFEKRVKIGEFTLVEKDIR